MMAESLETRKVEKRPLFDVTLPMRRAQRDMTSTLAPDEEEQTENTIKFSLLSKKGNRPQTRAIDLPSDSSFAIAMRTQQEAEREEQQRIKRLVLNYDMHDNDDENANGTYIFPLQLNPNRRNQIPIAGRSRTSDYIHQVKKTKQNTAGEGGSSGPHTFQEAISQDFASKGQSTRGTSRRQQTKKLQLSDMNW